MPWLPKETASRWEKKLPKYWTGETIYAESAIKAIRALGHEEDLKYMSYPYFYASFFIYHPREFYMIKPFVTFKNIFPICVAAVSVLSQRTIAFIRNIAREKLGVKNSALMYNGVSDIIECERIIYEFIELEHRG